MNEYDNNTLYLKCTIEYPDINEVTINHSRHNPKEVYPEYDDFDMLTCITFIPKTSKWIDSVKFNAKYEYKKGSDIPNLILSASLKCNTYADSAINEWIKFAERAIGRFTTETHPVEVHYMGRLNETHSVEKPKPNPRRKKK